MQKLKYKITYPLLITGSKGFIGSNILRSLISMGHKNIHIILRNRKNLWRINDLLGYCIVHEVNLTNKKKLEYIIKKIKPKTVFHLATYGAYSFQNDFNKIKANNFQATVNLLNECLKYKFKVFINTGSNSEYGFKDKRMKETDILDPNSYYAIFKSAATHYCNYIAKINNLNIVTLRPFHVYGPNEEKNRLVPTIIDK